MATEYTNNFSQKIVEAVEVQIRKEVNKVFDIEKERIIKQLEETRDEVVAKATLRITKFMDINTLNDRMIITLDLRGKNE